LAADTSLPSPQVKAIVYSEQQPSNRKQKGNVLTNTPGWIHLMGTEQISMELQVNI